MHVRRNGVCEHEEKFESDHVFAPKKVDRENARLGGENSFWPTREKEEKISLTKIEWPN